MSIIVIIWVTNQRDLPETTNGGVGGAGTGEKDFFDTDTSVLDKKEHPLTSTTIFTIRALDVFFL